MTINANTHVLVSTVQKLYGVTRIYVHCHNTLSQNTRNAINYFVTNSKFGVINILKLVVFRYPRNSNKYFINKI